MTVDSSTQVLALQTPDIPHIIRPVCRADSKALRRNCWSHRSMTRTQEQLKRITKTQSNHRGLGIVIEALHSPGIIAYGQIMMLTACYEISDLIVVEAYRSQGIGTAMIQYLIGAFRYSQMRRIEIGVAASNPRALALYQRLGFVEAYELELNLGNGREPVIYLSLTLPDFDA